MRTRLPRIAHTVSIGIPIRPIRDAVVVRIERKLAGTGSRKQCSGGEGRPVVGRVKATVQWITGKVLGEILGN
ncbi:MAG: hypothetical protein ACE5FA_05115 [Dehalococcoidia bacterium]